MRTGTLRRLGRAVWTRRTRRPGDPELLSDVNGMISALSAREATAQD
jgi:hypothetical protein